LGEDITPPVWGLTVDGQQTRLPQSSANFLSLLVLAFILYLFRGLITPDSAVACTSQGVPGCTVNNFGTLTLLAALGIISVLLIQGIVRMDQLIRLVEAVRGKKEGNSDNHD
jgi:hypothetical protein